jgi:deazaflavin-dependent oxidoreductase (nitroreductase family)
MVSALRAGKGHVEGELAGLPLLILTNTGRQSGQKREIPLAYFVIESRLFVVASMGGADLNPPWYLNVVANPKVRVELNGVAFDASAKVVGPAEHERIYAGVCAVIPVFADYQARTKRIIPVVELVGARADLLKSLGAEMPAGA